MCLLLRKNYLVPQQQIPDDADEENLEEEENMGIAETYSDYMPSKLTIGLKHPDPVVETKIKCFICYLTVISGISCVCCSISLSSRHKDPTSLQLIKHLHTNLK